jgi:hypothetical protein
MGFPKTIPTIPVPYKLRKKGLFETIDRANIDGQYEQNKHVNTDEQIEDVNTYEQIDDVNTYEQIADVNKYEQIDDVNTYEQIEDADIDDQVYQTYHTEISGHILTISLTWLAIATIAYIYIK